MPRCLRRGRRSAQSRGNARPDAAATGQAKPAQRAGRPDPAACRAGQAGGAASTPESRSAAALALSHDPTYDEGSAQRIREAALSYSDIAVRGGWPRHPGRREIRTRRTQGANDDLLRKRLIISGDLAADKATGAYDERSPTPSSVSRCAMAWPRPER